MGETAENVARQYQISRADQEAFAVGEPAQGRRGATDGPVRGRDRAGPDERAERCRRTAACDPTRRRKGLAGLKPAFDKDGTVTAGTASPLTDGASAVLVCSEAYAKDHGLTPLARIVSVGISGCRNPRPWASGPSGRRRRRLARAGGLDAAKIDVVELNEAFASQAIACQRDLGIRDEALNRDGGAIALGHPLGATGARIVGKAAAILKRGTAAAMRSRRSASVAARASRR